MIVAPALDPPAPELLARTLRAMRRELRPARDAGDVSAGDTLVLSSGAWPLETARAALARRPARVLVLGRLGTHRDARTPSLRGLWALEEAARGSGLPVLTLRCGPVVGPDLPLWRQLARVRRLPRGGAKLVNPVVVDDVVATLRLALEQEREWQGWCEVAGAEPWTLAELRDAAQHCATAGPAAWEPPLDELDEHRLADPGPWMERFGLAPRRLVDALPSWSRAA